MPTLINKRFREEALMKYSASGLGPTSRLSFLEEYAGLLQARAIRQESPRIVCLCGSTRFYKEFDEANFKFTMLGHIVLTIGCNTKSDAGLGITADDKIALDKLHKKKIDLCDFVYVLDIDGYIGESTRSEMDYAYEIYKPVILRSTSTLI